MRIRVEIYIKEVALTNEKVEVNVRNCRKSSRRGWRTMFYVILYKDMEFLLRPMIFL